MAAVQIIFGLVNESFATDRTGCLTCHRYPGLVRLEKDNAFKVLHIDEAKQLKSAHGRIDCRRCHTPVIKIPHAGDSGVTCATEKCHVQDKEKIKAMKSSLGAFHKEERFAITRLDDSSSCRVCHPLYPHSKNHKMRAFLNMHTSYLVCEVCHLKKEGMDSVTFAWKEPEHVEFIGGPYGTHKKQEQEGTPQSGSVISRMLRIFSLQEPGPEDSQNQEREYKIVRIAAFSGDKQDKKLIMNTEDTERAREFHAQEKTMKSQEKERQLTYFHRKISKKEISVACNECHSSDGALDFAKLGFHEKRCKDLEYMNIKSLVTKYDVFYLPRLFGQ
jgi:hypothetical protein